MSDFNTLFNATCSNPSLGRVFNNALNNTDTGDLFTAARIAALRSFQEEQHQKTLIAQQLAAIQQQQAVSASHNNPLTMLLHQEQQLRELQTLAGLASLMNNNNHYSAPSIAPVQQAPSLDSSLLARLLSQTGNPITNVSSLEQQILPTVMDSPTTLLGAINGLHSAQAVSDMTSQITPPPDHRRRKGRSGTFPQKMHQMLLDLEQQADYSDIASFLPHGRAFCIHKPRDFCKLVMPKYFRMSRFSSFQRQLNLYEFHRIAEGPDKGAYAHPLFQKERAVLTTMMKRNKIKGVKKRISVEQDISSNGCDDSADTTEAL